MEDFNTIGDWIEETFGLNDDIKGRYSANQFDRVEDEFNELKYECNLPEPCLANIAKEAADVVIALSGMCRRYGIDLQAEVDKKMSINRDREWEVFKNGTGRHISSNKNWSTLQEI